MWKSGALTDSTQYGCALTSAPLSQPINYIQSNIHNLLSFIEHISLFHQKIYPYIHLVYKHIHKHIITSMCIYTCTYVCIFLSTSIYIRTHAWRYKAKSHGRSQLSPVSYLDHSNSCPASYLLTNQTYPSSFCLSILLNKTLVLFNHFV